MDSVVIQNDKRRRLKIQVFQDDEKTKVMFRRFVIYLLLFQYPMFRINMMFMKIFEQHLKLYRFIVASSCFVSFPSKVEDTSRSILLSRPKIGKISGQTSRNISCNRLTESEVRAVF